MKKRIIALFMAAITIFGMLSVPASAASLTTSGTVTIQQAGYIPSEAIQVNYMPILPARTNAGCVGVLSHHRTCRLFSHTPFLWGLKSSLSVVTLLCGVSAGMVLFLYNLGCIRAVKTGPYVIQSIVGMFGCVLPPFSLIGYYGM